MTQLSLTKLSIRDLAKSYGTTTALQPVSLDVRAGEFLTLLGPSGSGKTTLLMMIAGLTEPSGGTIRLDGEDITTRPAYRRDIGVVFQNYALFPHLTVAQNLAFPMQMRKRSAAETADAVGRSLELVRLPHLAGRYPRELSGGQQQRVAFARAIVFNPAIVLMDEPLGALDKKLRDELKLEIRKLHRDLGATVVYVTHDQDEAMLLSDRVCLMNNARIEQIAPPAELYARPVSRFAAEFIGDSNILLGVAEAGDRIRVASASLLCSPSQHLIATGGDVDVLIRPERLRIDSPSTQMSNRLDGTVSGIVDLGGTRHVLITLRDGTELKITLLGGDAAGLTPGNALTVTVAPEDVVRLPRGER